MLWIKLIFDGEEIEDTASGEDIKVIEEAYREHYGSRFGGIIEWGVFTKEEIEAWLEKKYWDDYYYAGDDYYTPSATAGDYSPSCPWNAPGMSVSDFI